MRQSNNNLEFDVMVIDVMATSQHSQNVAGSLCKNLKQT